MGVLNGDMKEEWEEGVGTEGQNKEGYMRKKRGQEEEACGEGWRGKST